MISLVWRSVTVLLQTAMSVFVMSLFLPPGFKQDCDRAFTTTRQNVVYAANRAVIDYAALNRALR